MELSGLSAPELLLYLEAEAPALRELDPHHQEVVVRIAQRLARRGHAPGFILAVVRSTIDLLTASDTVSTAPLPSPAEAAADERHAAARRLAEHARAVLREARAARRSNEVRKMRGVLQGIDRSRLQDALGEEGSRLAREIDGTLNRLATPVRRGRPRSRRFPV